MSDKKKKVALLLNYDLKEVFEKCTPEQTKELILAMINYDQSSILPEFSDGVLKFIWIPIRQDLDKKRANHEKTSEERAKAGAQGGRGKKKSSQIESKKSNSFLEKQIEAKKTNKANGDSDTDADDDSDVSKESNSFLEKQIEAKKANKANGDSDSDADEDESDGSKKSNSFSVKQIEAKKANKANGDSDSDADEDESDGSKKSNSFSVKQTEAKKANKANGDSDSDADEGDSDGSKKSNSFSVKQTEAKKAKKAEYDYDCDCDCDHDSYLNEMNTTATTGARKESTMRKIGEEYRQAFGNLNDDTVTKLGSLVVSYGARDVTAAIETAAKREPLPEHPPNYIAKVCADWLEQRERLAAGGNAS